MIDTSRKSARVPALISRKMGNGYLATRLSQIGNRWRFGIIFQRFRGDFPLAIYQEIENQAWWLIPATQHEELAAFCLRNGLVIVEE